MSNRGRDYGQKTAAGYVNRSEKILSWLNQHKRVASRGTDEALRNDPCAYKDPFGTIHCRLCRSKFTHLTAYLKHRSSARHITQMQVKARRNELRQTENSETAKRVLDATKHVLPNRLIREDSDIEAKLARMRAERAEAEARLVRATERPSSTLTFFKTKNLTTTAQPDTAAAKVNSTSNKLYGYGFALTLQYDLDKLVPYMPLQSPQFKIMNSFEQRTIRGNSIAHSQFIVIHFPGQSMYRNVALTVPSTSSARIDNCNSIWEPQTARYIIYGTVGGGSCSRE